MDVAASRNSAAARLDDLRVREESTLPPEILLPGARHSQEVKCLALGHALKSVPHSPMSFNASDGPNPWISVKSTPRTPYRAALTSNDGVFTCLVFTRGPNSLPTGLAPLLVSAVIKDSSFRSQSSILADRCRTATGLRLRHARPDRCPPVRRGSSRSKHGSAHHGSSP